jgi:hypothetical protein
MTLAELQAHAIALPPEDRWQLANALLQSLQPQSPKLSDKTGLAVSLIGMAKIDAPAPTDDEVAAMLDERLAQRYL